MPASRLEQCGAEGRVDVQVLTDDALGFARIEHATHRIDEDFQRFGAVVAEDLIAHQPPSAELQRPPAEPRH